MDPKDPLGEKLRDKGKANEDLYIAQMERERLERRKQAAAAAAGATGATGGAGACPRDGSLLVLKTEHGVSVDICPTCDGVWLDKGELEAIVKYENEPGATRWVRSLLGR